jgi:FtsP/CotA-like multicopper oxidase with cupredoxin domain
MVSGGRPGQNFRKKRATISGTHNPIIKGMSLFHCHLLNHEDKGMMAKILIK